MLRVALAVVHLLALGIGLPAIYARSRHLAHVGRRENALSQSLTADNWWGISAFLWLGSGLWRDLAGTEKGWSYYLDQPVFWIKMGLFAAIFALEVWPMVTLIRWRLDLSRGETPDANVLQRYGGVFARISAVQTVLLVAMVECATLLARGYYAR